MSEAQNGRTPGKSLRPRRGLKGDYNGKLTKKARPLVYQQCIEMLGRGCSRKAIMRALGLHLYTVQAIEVAEHGQVEAIRTNLVKELRTAARLQINRLIENPDAVPMNVAALTASQCIDKAEMLESRATVRVEEHKRIDIFSDYPQPGQFVDFVRKHFHPAQVKEVLSDSQNRPEMGFPGRKKLPIKQ